MEIISINNTSPKICFGAIYKPKNIYFNNLQKPIVNTIKAAMRQPLHKFNGATAEDFYKSKGFDFQISPHSKNSVFLTAYKDVRKIGTGKDSAITYSDFINIGEYEKNSEFRIDDIEISLKDKKFGNVLLFTTFLFAAITMFSIGITRGKFKNPISDTKPMTEYIDSIANMTKTLFSDTTKVLNNSKSH